MGLDPRNVLTGKDGKLFDDIGGFLAQVPTWQAQINVNNQGYQAAGSSLEAAIMTGYTVTLTFTETHVSDGMLAKLLMDLAAGKQPVFNFQGKLAGHNGTTGRYVFRYCVPDGNIGIADVQPGKILERAWSWRVNEAPDLQALLGI